MLSWPQNAANPISKDLNFKNVPGGRILLTQPTRGLPLVACTAVFQTLFSKILYGPQLCAACKVNHPMHVP